MKNSFFFLFFTERFFRLASFKIKIINNSEENSRYRFCGAVKATGRWRWRRKNQKHRIIYIILKVSLVVRETRCNERTKMIWRKRIQKRKLISSSSGAFWKFSSPLLPSPKITTVFFSKKKDIFLIFWILSVGFAEFKGKFLSNKDYIIINHRMAVTWKSHLKKIWIPKKKKLKV